MPRNVSSNRRGYGAGYQRARRAILGPSGNGNLPHDPPCHWRGPRCTGVATTGDHDPPLVEVAGYHHLNLVPSCAPCNYGHANRVVVRYPAASRAW